MSKKLLRRLIFWGIVAMAAVAIFLAMRPQPIAVETAVARVGPMQVTIDEDGQVRARDRFVLAAPVSGRLARIGLKEGDRVDRGQTIAYIHPEPLDPRSSEQSRARVAAAEAFERQARQQQESARLVWEQAKRDLERSARLAATGDIPGQVHERSETREREALRAYEAAKAGVEAAAAEVRGTRAELTAPGGKSGQVTPIRAPTAGRVIQLLEPSERIVTAGTPLLVLSDLSASDKLEVVVDVLSTDAVKIQQGAPVELVRWGGDEPLRTQVRLVEPYAFTKVSALGVEEQRVNVHADFLDDPGPLGDGYRVEAKIQIWYAPEVLQVPLSALVREGDGWAVFTAEEGLAKRRPVKIGQRNGEHAQIADGLEPGATIILHPPNDLEDGVKIIFAGASR